MVLLFTTWTYFCFINFFNHVVGAFCYSTTETIEITETDSTLNNCLSLFIPVVKNKQFELGIWANILFIFQYVIYYRYGTKLVCHALLQEQTA